MRIWLMGTALYIVIGLLWWMRYDTKQMKKEIPYEDFPTIAPLPLIRKCMAISAMFTGVPQLFVDLYYYVQLHYYVIKLHCLRWLIYKKYGPR